jgi:hypothetical protein
MILGSSLVFDLSDGIHLLTDSMGGLSLAFFSLMRCEFYVHLIL